VGSLAGSARSCRVIARQLRALPARAAHAIDTDPAVAGELADQIRTGYGGPWARQLAAGTTVRASSTRQLIVVGGDRPVVSAGASVTALIWGDQYGPRPGVTTVTRTTRRGRRVMFRRRATEQFRRRGTRSIARALARPAARILDRAGQAITRVWETS
jgi:hypothetical protein